MLIIFYKFFIVKVNGQNYFLDRVDVLNHFGSTYMYAGDLGRGMGDVYS